MAEVSFPVYDLRGRNGKGFKSILLDMRGKQESCSVEEKIQLTVMVEVESRGFVFYVFDDGIEQFLCQYDSTIELDDTIKIKRVNRLH